MNYFISDTHFIHNKLIELESRPFNSIEEHDNFIMNLCEALTENDTLYHLGDFVFGTDSERRQRLLDRWSRLKCKTVLIMGNHDRNKKEWYEQFFNEVNEYPIYFSKRIILSHYPIPVTEGTINIHGHLHGSILNLKNYINANIHIQNYKLLSEKEVRRLEGQLKPDNYKFLKEWWIDKQKFLTLRNDDLPLTEDGLIDFDKLNELKQKY